MDLYLVAFFCLSAQEKNYSISLFKHISHISKIFRINALVLLFRIVHLDVQPDNVMFPRKRSWQVKLLDFGSAVRWNPQGETKAERVLSPEYAGTT